MKTICLMAMAMMVAGCVTPSDIIMHENHYLEKTAYADTNAPYIGEWTTGVVPGLLSVCIRADGRVLMCSSVAHFGTGEGFVYREGSESAMIFEDGTTYRIKSVSNDCLITECYGQEFKFVSGRVPETCKQPFIDFMSE